GYRSTKGSDDTLKVEDLEFGVASPTNGRGLASPSLASSVAVERCLQSHIDLFVLSELQ
ncbi:hypothetical protein STEG23_002708, partial [Scotinomys teguina]